MKKILFFTAAFLCIQQLAAQTELKISPIPLLFGVGAISIEQGISESFGLDGDIILGEDFFGANLSGKYYFNPERGIDKFHIGAFFGTIGDENTPGIGFLAGTKLISRKNLLFEIGLGVGRNFDGGGLFYGKLHLGYRFTKKAYAETTGSN